jgi:hypothetical protein
MKTFHCDRCQALLFFESTQCLNCEHLLAYAPSLARVVALERAEGEGEHWHRAGAGTDTQTYKLCANYVGEHVCNWALPGDDPNTLCDSCRLTRVIPNLAVAGHRTAWAKLESAKRRLLYTLQALRCPVRSKAEDPSGLAYEFLASDNSQPKILTGHDNGLITVNIAEADDATRERERARLHEPYRTLLGHFRHEIGHYYWQRLIDGQPRIEAFRQTFGDERTDYGAALKHHYESGPPSNWEERYISTYAASHPWEDWAESWAHYMHMVDMLETAGDCGLRLEPQRSDEPTLRGSNSHTSSTAFDELISKWFPLTFVLNNLNRSMGMADGYPFVLTDPVIAKLRFIHDTVARQPRTD